jgi:hypothetical protein
MLKREKGTVCLNCGAAIEGANYCHNCGQVNDTRRLTFWELIGESLSNFFAIDGRIFRTIAGVFIRPGAVAKDFSQGKRMKYMNPVRFYFVASLLLITTIQFSRNSNIVNAKPNGDGIEQVKSMTEEERETARIKVIDEYLGNDGPGLLQKISGMTDLLVLYPEMSEEEAFEQFGLSAGFWNEFAFAQAEKAAQFASNQEDNLESFNQFLISKLFWILFLFIPILGLLLKLIYFRRDFYYPEHIFFALYQQGLFFLLSAIYNVIFDNQVIYIIVLLLFGIHLALAMRRFYNQSWPKTLLKFSLISLLGLIAFSAFFILALILVFVLM